MSFDLTIDVRGVRHGVITCIKAAESIRSHLACGGFVDTDCDDGVVAITCVRCLASQHQLESLPKKQWAIP